MNIEVQRRYIYIFYHGYQSQYTIFYAWRIWVTRKKKKIPRFSLYKFTNINNVLNLAEIRRVKILLNEQWRVLALCKTINLSTGLWLIWLTSLFAVMLWIRKTSNRYGNEIQLMKQFRTFYPIVLFFQSYFFLSHLFISIVPVAV